MAFVENADLSKFSFIYFPHNSNVFLFKQNWQKKTLLESQQTKADPPQDVENSRMSVKNDNGFLLFIPDCLLFLIPLFLNSGIEESI